VSSRQHLIILSQHLSVAFCPGFGRWYACVMHLGFSCSLTRAMDGRIMCCGIISSCQLALLVTSLPRLNTAISVLRTHKGIASQAIMTEIRWCCSKAIPTAARNGAARKLRCHIDPEACIAQPLHRSAPTNWLSTRHFRAKHAVGTSAKCISAPLPSGLLCESAPLTVAGRRRLSPPLKYCGSTSRDALSSHVTSRRWWKLDTGTE